LNRLLEERAAVDPVCTRLMSAPGVGPITSLTFTASIEDPQRFAKLEDVGAYAGLAPRRNQSGERDVRGNISKASDPMLRRALYEAANIMLCRVQRPFALQTWGKRVAEAKGGKRARIAGPQIGSVTPFTLAERYRVSLGMKPATFFPDSHARAISPGL
jgi:transposase